MTIAGKKCALVIFTDGRREELFRTVESFYDVIFHANFDYRIVVDDSDDADYAEWVAGFLSSMNFEVCHNERRLGFGGAVNRGWSLVPADVEYVFHLEDDFLLNRPISLPTMVRIMEHHPYLAQIALKRQPWNEVEKEWGDLTAGWPDEFHQKGMDQSFWLEHRLWFTTNPSLIRASCTRGGFPVTDGSEETFSKNLLEDPDLQFALWDERGSAPSVEHIGHERSKAWKA